MRRTVSFGAVLVLLVSTVAAAQIAQRPAVRDYAAELTCAPEAALVPPAATLRIIGGSEKGREMFAVGDAVVLNGGTSQGLKPGQTYLVRRAIKDRFTSPIAGGVPTVSVHSVAWVRINDAQAEVAHGTITRACDSVESGDYLEPLTLPAVPLAAPEGQPDFSTPGHLILGDERRQMGGEGSWMVVDRGSDHGIKTGQRLTVFRRTAGGAGPVQRVAEATAVLVKPETTVIRIDSSVDAIYVGDLVAVHR